MSAGTIMLTNNSAAVSGTGTAFTTDLKAGDFIVSVVGGVTYTLPVKTVNSATGVTLLKNYDGPTQAGAAWSAVPRDTMNAITSQLAAETAQALRGLNYDKQNWQQVFSGTGTITVRLPDGSTYTGPAWNSFTTALNLKADKASLGSSASKDVGSASGNVMEVGAFGLGSIYGATASGTSQSLPVGLYYGTGNDWGKPGGTTNGLVILQLPGSTQSWRGQFGISDTGLGTCYLRYGQGGSGFSNWKALYGESNTTVDSSGFIKKASPIINIYHDGTFETNDESEGALVSRESVGVYRISNVLGMNSDRAWGGNDGGFEIPKDRNGQRLLWLDYEIDPDGSILVKTYHRTYPNAPKFARNEREDVKEAEPVDIPADQFLSVRVEMPQGSVWDLAQKSAQEEMAQEQIAQE